MSVCSVLVGVLAEDVPDDHNGLLHHVVDLCLDQVQQSADTTLGRLLAKKKTAMTCHVTAKGHKD